MCSDFCFYVIFESTSQENVTTYPALSPPPRTQSTTAFQSTGATSRTCFEQSLLSLRKQQAIASLAFSCDWLSHKLLKICVAIKHQSSSTASDAHFTHLGSKNSPRRSIDFEGRKSSSAGGATTPAQKLRQIGRKLAQLADDSLLCLRLEVNSV